MRITKERTNIYSAILFPENLSEKERFKILKKLVEKLTNNLWTVIETKKGKR